MPEAISKLIAAILASTKTHKWWWAGGGGATLVAIVALVVVFGGFFGPSGKAICTIALERARDYGVIPGSAVLADNDAKTTEVKNRRQCTAVADGQNYTITADVTTTDTAELKCKKGITKNKECVALYSVARSDGKSTYQVRAPEEDTSETAAIAPNAGATPDTGAAPAEAVPAAASDAAAAPGGDDSDLAVSNQGAAGPAQPANNQPAPQQTDDSQSAPQQ